MIKIENLVKKFKNLVAVNNLSLEIKKGETFALLGLNGAGKTTTINILCSLLTATSGKVIIDGKDLEKESTEIKQIISLSPQETAIANNLTVKENCELISSLYGFKKDDAKITAIIKKFGLTEKTNSLSKTLSGGQKRRLSIALAIISNPKILFLDEPTLGLDIKARRQLWAIIKELQKNITIILTTHYLEEVEALANRVGIMSNGKLVAYGSIDEIKKQTKQNTFEDAFLMLTNEEAQDE